MTKQNIIAYYKKWGNDELTNDNAIMFTNMLMKKATLALRDGINIMANDKMRTGKELEQMYCLAEDIFCDNPELRGI